MPTSTLPVIDLIIQDLSTGALTLVPSNAVKFYQFTDSTDSALSPDPGLSSGADGVLPASSVNVAAATQIRARSIFQGMANYSEVVTV
jgi:hypothetical protein